MKKADLIPLDDLPRVSISAFQTNPVRYIQSGALVANHGRPQAAFMPVRDETTQNGAELESIKAQLLLLGRVRSPSDVDRELAELSDSRSAESVGDAR